MNKRGFFNIKCGFKRILYRFAGKSRSRIRKKNKTRLERDIAKKKLYDKKKIISSLP